MAAEGLLKFYDGAPFAIGATVYRIGPRGTPTEGRLLLPIAVEGQQTVAALDTGGHYLVCEPDLAEILRTRLTDFIESASLVIRGVKFSGDLYRLTLEMQGGQGESYRLDATAFIPRLALGQEWNLPSFIGWRGVLERLRFAIDPATDTFYFGPL